MVVTTIEHDKEKIKLGDEYVEIDKAIIPLIETLNKYGLVTTQSCQGHSDQTRDENTNAYLSISYENITTIIHRPDENRLIIFWKRPSIKTASKDTRNEISHP